MPSMSVIASPLDRLLTELSDELRLLDAAALRRQLISIEAVDGPLVQFGGRKLVCWCANDYLGLSTHPRLVAAATTAASEWGLGARASRLLAGTTIWHTRLERALADWFGAEDAIVFPSGYLTNLGTLGALLSSDDLVIVDRLVHASLLDAARASRATLKVFHHNDAAHLAQLLSRTPSGRRRLIVTEGVFSMDGDLAPLRDLLAVVEAHEAMLYVDDAHGAFVLGEQGRGTPAALGVSHARFLYMGTLGKALGCQGGFLVGPSPLIEWLRNRARPFIYSTALATPLAAAAVEALQVLRDEPQRRRQLHERVDRLRTQLARHGASTIHVPSHIVPIHLGETPRALEIAQRLFEQGHWAPAIRPPTVPQGTARLRLSLSALHTEAHIDSLAQLLADELRQPRVG